MKKVKVNVSGEAIKVNIFEKRELIEKLDFTEEDARLVIIYQKTFPELLQDGVEGFVIDARTLWEQLDKPYDRFTHWIERKVLTKSLKIGKDLEVSGKKSTNPIIGGRPSVINYKFTIDMAKHVALIENTSKGQLVRDYFIRMEKALRDYERWIEVREPEKAGYKELCKQLDIYYRNTHDGKKTSIFVFTNEADMINKALLGKRAMEIKATLEYKDNETREHLNTRTNKALYELQILDSSLVIAGVDFEQRKAIVESTCKAKHQDLVIAINQEFGEVA